MKNFKTAAGYFFLLTGLFGSPALFLYFKFVGSGLAPGEAAGLGFAFAAMYGVTFVLFVIGAILVGGLKKSPHSFALSNILIWLGILEYAIPFLALPARIYIALVQSYPYAGTGLTILVLYLLTPLLLKLFRNRKTIPKTVQIACLIVAALLCLYQFLFIQ
jgi:hypothetical protein